MSPFLEIARRHLILIAVFVPATLLTVWESRVHVNSMILKLPENEVERLDVDRTMEFVDAYGTLFPHHPEREIYQGIYDMNIRDDWEAAREHFENALRTGIKTEENLLYYYAIVLVHLQEDPAKIDAAIADWRGNFPTSSRPDPHEYPGSS